MRFKFIGALAFLLLAIASPALGQVAVEEVYHKTYPIEPGRADDMAVGTPAALGDGAIVFKFKVTDVDPIADDPSNVSVNCILIQNLGTATTDDLVQVMILDQDGNSVGTIDTTLAVGADSCPNHAPTVAGQNHIGFEAVFDLTAEPFVIPDDSMETFQVAVRIDSSNNLTDDSQNHTIALQATLDVSETVGSVPAGTNFIAPVVMDTMPDVIWNGGINKYTEDTWVVNPIMPGDVGVVSRFTVCDYDANEHELVIERFFIKQREQGNALSTDLTALTLYRVEGFTRTMVASRVPTEAFNRSTITPGGLQMPDAGSPAAGIIIPDDKCMTFELEAKVSPFAVKMHVIQPRIQIGTREPRNAGASVNQTVNPEIKTSIGTMIGKGGLILPDTKLIGKPGILPLQVMGIQLPGMGTLQVGPTGKLQYDPHVINIKSIRGVKPYIVDATEINNRTGEVRFTVRIDPALDVDGDGEPDDPRLTGVQDGTIANIFIEPIGKPGDGTRLVLTFDCLELVGQMNCIPTGFPFPETPNQNPNNDITVSAGMVMLLHPGDVDFDGQPTIGDALKVANALLSCTETRSTNNNNNNNGGVVGNTGTTTTASTDPVSWTSGVNVSINGNDLRKNAGSDAFNAGAVSTERVNGNGFVEVTVNETNTNRMFGLSRGNTDVDFDDIDFAIQLRDNGTLRVRRNGDVVFDPTPAFNYRSGDVVRIEVNDNDVLFKLNGTTFFTLSNVITTSSFPLLVDTSLRTINATLENVTVGTTTTNNGGNNGGNNNDDNFVGRISDLTDEQKSAADVARPFAGSNEIPDCNTLTSADVAEIARLAINFGTEPAPASAMPMAVTTQSMNKPWYSFLTEMWNWITGASTQADVAQVELNFNAAGNTFDLQITDVPAMALGGVQGRLYFDPTATQINGVRGLNGYNVVALEVDNAIGEVRFMALTSKGQGIHQGNIMQFATTGAPLNPTLDVEALVDENAMPIPYTLNQERLGASAPVALSVHSVQALAQDNGAFRFRAEGTGIAGMQVQVYNLAGTKLFDQETAGNSLMFQPFNNAGQPLANGVYLYTVTAQGFNGETIRSTVKKLAILR